MLFVNKLCETSATGVTLQAYLQDEKKNLIFILVRL